MPKKAFVFQFKNPVQDSGEALTNVLFINDTPAEGDILRLEAEAEPDVTITLNQVDDKVVSDSNYHFKLTFSPAALALPEGISLDASHAALWGLVCIAEAAAAASAEGERAPGDIDLYFLYKGDANLEVNTGNPLSLTLRKVGARSSGGTRPTLVQLKLNKRETDVDKFVVLAGPGGDYNLTENADLDLLAPRGQAAPTLMAGFVSSDIILNDGATENGLVLRIVNTGLLPISLSPEGSASPSRFTLRFEAHDTISQISALARAAQVGEILIPAKKEGAIWVSDPGWSGKDDWTVTHPAGEPTWTLTPKARQTSLLPGKALEVPIGKIITGHATGRTALRIGYSGLPGHGDGELVAFIQKYPLVFAGQLVGVGTGSPSEKLTVKTAPSTNGITHTDGTVKLTTRVDEYGAALGTHSAHDLRFFAGGTINNMVLKTDGKVGIGTSSPSETLTVATVQGYGITHSVGGVTLSTWVGNTVKDEKGGLGTQTDHPLYFFTNKATRMTLTTDGKVGIGTDSPDELLTVQTENGLGITHTNGTVRLSTGIDGTGAALGTIGDHDLRFFTKSAVRMWLKADGKVGIGTDSPSTKLTVQTATDDFGITHTNGTVKLFTWVGTDVAVLGTLGNHHLYFQTDNTNRMSVMADGNVGIGTTTPAATLDVHGDFMIKGKKPIECWTAQLNGGARSLETPYLIADWLAVIAGVYINCPDDSNDTNRGFQCYADERTGTKWRILAEMHHIGNNKAFVHVIFIRRELVSGGPYTY